MWTSNLFGLLYSYSYRKSRRYLGEKSQNFPSVKRSFAKIHALLKTPFLKERHHLEISVERFISMHSHNESYLASQLDRALFDETVGYMSDAGMPAISDPGHALVRFCQEKNIPYEVLPGANAALLAYVASGIPTHQFTFYGFLPHKGAERHQGLLEVLQYAICHNSYESPSSH